MSLFELPLQQIMNLWPQLLCASCKEKAKIASISFHKCIQSAVQSLPQPKIVQNEKRSIPYAVYFDDVCKRFSSNSHSMEKKIYLKYIVANSVILSAAAAAMEENKFPNSTEFWKAN